MLRVFRQIQADHELIEARLEALVWREELGCPTPVEREAELAGIESLLLAHFAAEERTLYTPLQHAVDEWAIKSGLTAHHLVRRMLPELRGLAASPRRWQACLGVLRQLVSCHFAEEESELFAIARRTLTIAQLGAYDETAAA